VKRNPLELRGYRAVLYKEVRHLVRDRITLVISLGLPLLQMTIFGYAINTKVEHIRSAVYDEDRGSQAIALIDALRASKIFDVTVVARSRRQLEDLIVAGDVRAAFDIPPNFTADVESHRPAHVSALVDGSDSSVAQPAYAGATAIGAAFAGVPPSVVDVRTRVLFNPGLQSAHFLVPGLIGVIMQLITMFLTALSIVGERERGTLDQLLVTPVGALGIMLGKITPYAAVGFVDFLLVLAGMRFVFGVPIAGNLALLLLLSAGFLLAALGLGLLVSSAAKTQVQAMLGVFALTLPSILLSGFFFELYLMPPVMQFLSLLIPLTYFLQILRGIILRGAGIEQLWPQVVAMLVLGTALIIIASVRFARSTGSRFA